MRRGPSSHAHSKHLRTLALAMLPNRLTGSLASPVELGNRLAAARTLRLNRRAFHRAERAENAAISGIRPQQRAAARALVIELAGVGRHGFGLGTAAFRTGQNRFEEEELAHYLSVDG